MTTYFDYPSKELQDELSRIAQALVAPGKGILACDENKTTLGQRLQDVGVSNTAENRHAFRQVMFYIDPKLGENISAVALYKETLEQRAYDGTTFIELLKRRRIIVGIKVDKESNFLSGSQSEYTTQGLDDMGKRCAEYKQKGCDFAKFRCIYIISKHTPSYQCIMENANVLARYASICQSERFTPVVETDVLTDGDHDLERSQKVTETVLAALFKALNDHHVFLEGIILKTNMITPGVQCKKPVTAEKIALATVQTMRRCVPAAVPGIAFLSGGQSEEDARIRLNAINNVPLFKPWALTFAYGRALQLPVLRTWRGMRENIALAQQELLMRAKWVGQAAVGKYVRANIAPRIGPGPLPY